MKRKLRLGLSTGLMCIATCMALYSQPSLAARDAKAILNETCRGCHTPEGNDALSRISHQRKTPEGWLMSIARMQVMHGVQISDEDRRTLVKYLADTQGLAPSETEGVRYALERRLNTVEKFDDQTSQMCARCHSGARVALQRRPAEEWEELVNFHLGQWPSLEYQLLARDREWFDIARKEMVPLLAKRYPLDNPAWKKWLSTSPNAEALVGEWNFSGHLPGKGEVAGVMSVAADGSDTFKVNVKGQYADGSPFNGDGSAILYTGYEWRGKVKIDGVTMRQVFAAQGDSMQGRMFEAEHDERGLDFVAAKQGSNRLLAVQPGYLKAGSETEVILVGSGMVGTPNFGKGVEVVEVLEQSADRIRVKLKAAVNAQPGLRNVTIGTLKGPTLSVYSNISEIKVVPAFSVARIGGGGGSTPKVQGRFDAEAWGKDAEGKPYRIGIVPAQWSVAAFDERAEEDEDVKFAGTMHADTGVFTPGDAGPNPARKMSTNNAGNLKVIAAVDDAGKSLTGEGQMIVTVQRWNNPPIP
ncbi:TPA: quinohemoprotein amine dehydrogenase subunit alpha [Pseudomonas aeruginosa]|uniref:quinohemoprotein amine dehydrogenase subunit alpha n=1 Tax=Pseudomonas TaxID=286 RepID=UPI0003B9BFC1|nr:MULTISPECIES: quinohemoprotein amine dehydrogenase subunit alpha [Pseudomonas]EKN0212702.1 quinohemoprotein amine dehydrogenase subunit alpha [Pseudomonas aeruginosa]EKT8164456.1 quinohemoprotein amine dehydrogenase subunit alpha [Pseudomonas aeruginosa]EKU3717571.1 quinohemoprotein amine dehydrogenase subunit alpha [Pseudomonas aeruginosa]EKW9639363.1 quinohemoprotein amine dehydrogenase subunit alpha [Pseudomonas aeruginosa]EKX2955824.1 quinohemoprotein amine dehydrogenase subunit alpha [